MLYKVALSIEALDEIMNTFYSSVTIQVKD